MNNKRGRGRPKKTKNAYNNEPKDYSNNISGEEKKDENIIVFFALSDDESLESHENHESQGQTENDTKQVNQVNQVNQANQTNQTDNEDNNDDDYLDNILEEQEDTLTQITFDINDGLTAEEIPNAITENECEKQETTKKVFTKKQISYNCIQLNMNNKPYEPVNKNIKCWWCDEYFDNLPAYIVSNYKNGEYYIFGNFCSFNCSAKYNVVMLKDHKWNTRHALTTNLKNKIMNNNEPIKLAPDRELLISKGGILSIEEFRHGFDTYGSAPKINMPPIIPLIHVINNGKFL